MEYGTLHYKIELSQAKLNEVIDSGLSEALSLDAMEVNGVVVYLNKAGDSCSILEGKALNVQVPLDIQVKKDAGLFSIEGQGGILLDLKLNYDITRDLQLKCKTEIVKHSWTSKPKLELGALHIPVETLMNLVLEHYESVLTAKVDEVINSKSDLVPLVYQSITSLESHLNNSLPFESEVDLKFYRISNLTPRTVDDTVFINGIIEVDLALQSKNKLKNDQLPLTSWVTNLDHSRVVKPELVVSYNDLSRLLVEHLSGSEIGGKKIVIEKLSITGGTIVKLISELSQPIKGKVEVSALPIYNNGGNISLSNLDVKVSPSNIVYKLTAPLVNKFIETKIEQFFPLNIQSLIDKQIDNLPKAVTFPNIKITPGLDNVMISNIQFLEHELYVKLAIENLKLDLKIV